MSTQNLLFLGTGTSMGVPVPGCSCKVCCSRNPRDRRFRCSVLIEKTEHQILIDTSPEFRLQALRAGIDHLDAVFWTHAHADHLHGLDDLRPLTLENPLDGYASLETVASIQQRFPYLWEGRQKGKPRLLLHSVRSNEKIELGELTMQPIPVMHGKLALFGWRCGSMAYLTDVNKIPETSYPLLENLEILIIGALRFESHPTHFSVDEALKEIKKIGPKRAYLTHISHEIGYRSLKHLLPKNVFLAYDGLQLQF